MRPDQTAKPCVAEGIVPSGQERTKESANEDAEVPTLREDRAKAEAALLGAQGRLKKVMLESTRDDADSDTVARESQAIDEVAAAKRELERLEAILKPSAGSLLGPTPR
ncbi:MAG: hypothetical protein GY811_10535 [Myxococcales bacterium]|nr:hypothetical protein [Myxococcales bacterium]